jgi:hypothetical protein
MSPFWVLPISSAPFTYSNIRNSLPRRRISNRKRRWIFAKGRKTIKVISPVADNERVVRPGFGPVERRRVFFEALSSPISEDTLKFDSKDDIPAIA